MKKAFLVLAAVLLVVPATVYPGIDAGLDWVTANREAQEIGIVMEEQQVQEQLAQIREQIEAGNATPEDIELEQNLTAMLGEVQEERQQATEKKAAVVVGRAREEATPVSFEIHVMGMIVAALYLFLYRRESYYRFRNDMESFWGWANGLVKP